MNLGDPELELIDPTPNVHLLFIHFDKLFFWTKLASRAVVRWSKRMYSCAGICSYDRGGLCDIALSEPLLKLRPRKDLIETLLHEMIHAFLFITNRDRDRDGHGPNFQAHMHRINRCAGLNISIYHSFIEEVQLYQTHWWRCNGPCQNKRPHFGIVRRSANRAPGPSDCWWKNHQKYCGGTFVKIKEPENQGKKKKSTKTNNGDISKYIQKTDNSNKEITDKTIKPILKDSTNMKTINTIKNNNSTLVVTKKNVIFNPQPNKPPAVFIGSGQKLIASKSTISTNVAETVRNVWANKQLSPVISQKDKNSNKKNSINLNKTKADSYDSSPPKKIMKIDDYFKNNAKTVLKDIYGKDFDVQEIKSNKEKRLSVVPVEIELVCCPVCDTKIGNTEINKHLDECLNKKVIDEISKEIKKEPINPLYTPSTSKTPNSPFNKTLSNETLICKQMNSSRNKSNNPIKIEKVIDSIKIEEVHIKVEPSVSEESKPQCPCCGSNVYKTIEDHLDECLAFFDNNTSIPEEGKSSILNETIVIEDDDEFDESQTLNATGTKLPCPCCMEMIEEAEMNNHLDLCLN